MLLISFKKKVTLFLVVVIAITACSTSRSFQSVDLCKAKKTVLQKEGFLECHYWEFKNSDLLWSTNVDSAYSLEAYRDTLISTLGASKYREVIVDRSTQALPVDVLQNLTNGDRINKMLVNSGKLGVVRPINNLEAQILNYQIDRFPLYSHPTEFHAFIIKHQPSDKLRVYFIADEKQWPPRPGLIIQAIEYLQTQGWQLKYHLHNHYEDIDNDKLGILAPSLADAQYFKMLSERFNIEKTLITNGLHTVEIMQDEFDQFKSH